MFGDKIKYLQEKNGKTKQQIYTDLEISNVSYWRYENGTQQPTLDILIKFADYYKVSIDWLAGRTHNPEINHEQLDHGKNAG